MSLLPPEGSVIAGVATAALVYGIYNASLPTVADARTAEPHDQDLASAERTASWTAAAIVAGVSLMAKDPTIFVIGGIAVIVLSWTHRHANMVDPATGYAVGAGLHNVDLPGGVDYTAATAA